MFGHAVERHFRRFDLFRRQNGFAGVQRPGRHLAADAHQFAQQGEIINLRCKIPRAEQGRARSGQLRQISWPTKGFHRLIGLKHRLKRDRGRHHGSIHQLHDRIINPAVHRLKKMFGAQLQLHILCHAIVDHQRTQKGGLCLNIMGKLHSGVAGIVNQSNGVCHFSLMAQAAGNAK